MKADLLFYNGEIHTIDETSNIFYWMRVRNGRILELGTESSLLNETMSDVEKIDLNGQSVYPGFFDSHVHLVQTALNMLALDLSNCNSIEHIKSCIKAHIANNDTDENTIIYGYGLDETKLIEMKLPDRKDLDTCSKTLPIWINRVEYHTSVVNSKALHMCCIPYTLKGIERVGSGLPTGRFTSEASAWIRNFMHNRITDATREKGVYKAIDTFIKKGVTSVDCMEGGYMFHDADAEYILKNHKRFPIDLYLYYQTLDVLKVKNHGLKRIGGCIFIDGSFGSRTAAISEPYLDNPSTNGIVFFDQETINEFVEQAQKNEMQVAVHAIGDRAIELVLNAYERAQNLYPSIKINHRIEHFELPTDNQIKRAKALNVIISVQPAYEYKWGMENGMYSKRLGVITKSKTNPFRKYIDEGLLIIGGSDCDVTPCDPLLGIHAAVNHPNVEFSITVEEALKLFTVNAAKAVGDFKNKGSLEIGKLADFVVLDQNLLKLNPQKIRLVNVLATYKEGIALFSREGEAFE